MLHLILIRHGRTAWNDEAAQGERFRGMVDVPLQAEGLAQARVTAHRLAGWPLAAVYASPLSRATRTAELVAAPHHLVAKRLPGLQTLNFGEWAGQLCTDVARRWPEQYQAWRRNPFNAEIPGGDRLADLRDRAVAAGRTAIGPHADGESLVFVTHQVVARVLVCALAGLPEAAFWQIRQDLCNLSRFDYDSTTDTFHVACLNDTCHLTPALAQVDGGGTRIVLIRHGQTAWNVGAGEERFRGRTDLPLDAAGLAQANAVADWLAAESVAALYCSPLLRARQTAAPLGAGQRLPVEAHPGLIDIDYGRFQGLTHAEASTAYPDLYRLWQTRPGQVRFPDGEALSDVQARLQALLAELAARHPGQTVALVGHEVVNKVLACTLLGLDLDHTGHVRHDPAGLDVFQLADEHWLTLCVNDTCHLADVDAVGQA